MPTSTILQAMADEKLFGPFFRGKSWDSWKAMLGALFGLPLTDAQVETYRAHTGRADMPVEQFSEAWLVCGRRSGKSRIAALVATYLATFIDWRRYLAAGEVATVMLLAADRKQASVLMNYILGFLHAIPILHRLVESETRDTVRLTNRVEISIHTSSFRSVRGYSIVAVLADEIGFWQDADSKNPANEILQALRPAMAQFPNALLLCFSSPYAKRGVLFEAYRDHHGKGDSPVLVWQGASRAMNPTISPLTVMRAKLQDAAAARSEFEAQFRDDLESMFAREMLESCTIRGRRELANRPGMNYRAFVDPSGGSSDSMTMAIAHEENGKGVLDLVREIVPPFSPDEVVREFAAELQRFHIHEVVGDAYGGEWPREQFRKLGIGYKVSDRTRSELYLAFLPKLMSRTIELLDHERVILQFCNLERRTGRSGKDSVDHPSGSHDDVSNAVAGALGMLGADQVELTLVDQINQQYDAWIAAGRPPLPEPEKVPTAEELWKARNPERAAPVIHAGERKCCSTPLYVQRGALTHCNNCGAEFGHIAAPPVVGGRRGL